MIQSLHKTLSSLTQTAIAHVGSKYDEKLSRALDIFETSSPSYLLIASADRCVSDLSENRSYISEKWQSALSLSRGRLKTLSRLTLFECENYDASKFVILTGKTNIDGYTLAGILRKDHGIEVEAAFPTHIIAMSGEGDTKESLSRFANALIEIDRGLEAVGNTPFSPSLSLPETALPICEAVLRVSRTVPLEKAPGRISAEYILPYPPGVPLIVPGEVFDFETVALVRHYENLLGIDLASGVEVL